MPPLRKVLQRAEAKLKSIGIEVQSKFTPFILLSNGGAMNNIEAGFDTINNHLKFQIYLTEIKSH